MKTILAAAFAAITILGSVDYASAQGVRPHFNYQGQAVCPEGYDYVGSLCRPRGYGGGPGYYRGAYGGEGSHLDGTVAVQQCAQRAAIFMRTLECADPKGDEKCRTGR